MMTFLDIAARNERDHEEQLALREEQVRLKDAYCCELEDVIRLDDAYFDIAVEMLSVDMGISVDRVRAVIGQRYEREQKVAS